MHCGVSHPATPSSLVPKSPFLCTSVELLMSHTPPPPSHTRCGAAADRDAKDDSTALSERRRTVPSSLFARTSRKRGGRSLASEGEPTKEASNALPPFPSPKSAASPSNQYLLEVIQQQQERIVALQTSLLYATEYSQRASHPFSFQDAADDEMQLSEVEIEAQGLYSACSLPGSEVELEEDGVAYSPLLRPTFITSADKARQATVTNSLLCSSPATQTLLTDVPSEATPLRLDVEAVTSSPLRLTLPTSPQKSLETSPTASDSGAAPLTHRVRTLSPKDVTAAADVEEDDECDDKEVEKEGSEAIKGASAVRDGDATCVPVPTPRTDCDELQQLRERVQQLTASRLHLRLQCARQVRERRDMVNDFHKVLGCVQALLDDAQQHASLKIPSFLENKLEYVVRQCWRSLVSAGAGGPRAASPLAERTDSDNGSPAAANTTVHITSPVGGGQRTVSTPDIILHRQCDRFYL